MGTWVLTAQYRHQRELAVRKSALPVGFGGYVLKIPAMRTLLTILLSGLHGLALPIIGEDLVEVKLGPEAIAALENVPSHARLILFFSRGKLGGVDPADGPFPFQPAPIASWSLEDQSVQLDRNEGSLIAGAPSAFYPVEPNELEGVFRVQAVIDIPSIYPGHRAPGDLFGPTETVRLAADRDDTMELSINRVRQAEVPRESLYTIELESNLLPPEFGAGAKHRAWVALPHGYDDIHAARRNWPTIYFIPDHGTTTEAANTIARLLARPEIKMIMPQAIWVILDPRSATGHHYFTDSPTNGARSRALVEELIPWLEVRFRTVPDANARLLFGIGAGGRAALSLLADHPEVFSQTSAISPEAISFGSLRMLNVYKDKNAFRTLDGEARPAIRSPLGPERDRVHASIEDEVGIAHAISPTGYSGTPWDAMRAAFGSTFEPRQAPPWPFDRESGAIDPEVVSGWRRHDLILRALEDPGYSSRLRALGHVAVGERDQWYRNYGVQSLEVVVGTKFTSDEAGSTETGVIEITPDATAEQVAASARLRIFDAMIDHLRKNSLHN